MSETTNATQGIVTSWEFEGTPMNPFAVATGAITAITKFDHMSDADKVANVTQVLAELETELKRRAL